MAGIARCLWWVTGTGLHFLLCLVAFSRGAIVATGTVAITLDGNDEEIRSLANWLRDEEDLRGRVRTENAPIQEGRMGGVLESVVVILTSATTATVFTSVKDWLIARKSAGKVTLKLKSATGRELELSCGSPDDLENVIDNARKFLDEGV
jgi:Effector Associated Constant Component 1